MNDIIQNIIAQIMDIFTNYIYVDFVMVNILAVYIMLKTIFRNKSEVFKTYLNLVVASILVYVFFKLDYDLTRLIVSGLTSVAFYQWIIKSILKTIGNVFTGKKS